MTASARPVGTLARLKRFGRALTAPGCELCSRELSEQHEHLLELAEARLRCVCHACALLFGGTGEQRYLRVERTIEALTGLALAEAGYARLGIPVGLACVVQRSGRERVRAPEVVAIYPGPGGATEARLPVSAWQLLAEHHRELTHIAPDVEALLIDRTSGSARYFRVSIDVCFEFAGLLRARAPASSATAIVEEFLAGLERQAGGVHRSIASESHA